MLKNKALAGGILRMARATESLQSKKMGLTIAGWLAASLNLEKMLKGREKAAWAAIKKILEPSLETLPIGFVRESTSRFNRAARQHPLIMQIRVRQGHMTPELVARGLLGN